VAGYTYDQAFSFLERTPDRGLVAGERSDRRASPAAQTFGPWNYSWPGSASERNCVSINVSVSNRCGIMQGSL